MTVVTVDNDYVLNPLYKPVYQLSQRCDSCITLREGVSPESLREKVGLSDEVWRFREKSGILLFESQELLDGYHVLLHKDHVKLSPFSCMRNRL